MLDIKLLRKDPQALETKLKTKDPEIDLGPLLALDEKIRHVIAQVEELQAKRNSLSKEIGEKKRKGEDVAGVMSQVSGLGDKVSALNHERTELEKELTHKLACLPNLPSDEAKVSPDPKDNVCIKTWGQKREFDFPFKNHVELNEKLKLFDFKRAAKTSGSGWPAYCNMGARLEWALINFMIDIHIENGFEMWMPPHLIKPETMFASAQLPKFEHQLFKIKDDDYNLYLIPTSETVLNGLHMDEIFAEVELPKRYMAYTPCFRREAGAAGSQERGLIRMHQFNKVEMFAFTKPDQSEPMFQQMVSSAEQILQGLNIHYRNMLLVTGDMSFAAMKTIDVEVWLPGQNRYYEVSSISNCGDFQSRRSMTRYKHGDGKPEFVYTLNGSGLATSRLMVALLENNQRPDGSVEIPLVLHQYLNGVTQLCPIS
ncbi:MAG TPA: serine--tRNA ligase [Rhabdochlamydiaceae bacterium]|jgi:seryl-tRNA synthetase|nr:serine--tRNA ligase [Rhabdochlamydiaceae bacterium]